MSQRAALERLHRQAARGAQEAQEIAYLRRALADLRGCVVAFLDATAEERTGNPTPEEADLYSALRRSAAVLRAERDVGFPGGHES